MVTLKFFCPSAIATMFIAVLLIAIGVVGPSTAQLGTTCVVYEQVTAAGLCPSADAATCNEYCRGRYGALRLGAMCSAEQPNTTRECICMLKCSCDVYEQELTTGLCANGTDAAKCNEYCNNTFGSELLGAECSPERLNKHRECICKINCCNQGCSSDNGSHCRTCDGVTFGYQGLMKQYMIKPITNYSNIPYFTIARTNKVWQQGPMAVLDTLEVYVKDWKFFIEVKAPDGPTAGFIVKVNGVLKDLPYRWSKFEDHRERFVNVVWATPPRPKSYWSPALAFAL